MIFHLEVTKHCGQFGETSAAERAVLIGVLQQAAQRLGSGHPIGGAANPESLTVGGQVVGTFWVGPKAHSAGPHSVHDRKPAAGPARAPLTTLPELEGG